MATFYRRHIFKKIFQPWISFHLSINFQHQIFFAFPIHSLTRIVITFDLPSTTNLQKYLNFSPLDKFASKNSFCCILKIFLDKKLRWQSRLTLHRRHILQSCSRVPIKFDLFRNQSLIFSEIKVLSLCKSKFSCNLKSKTIKQLRKTLTINGINVFVSEFWKFAHKCAAFIV